ncbi:MAG: glycosyltransferase [Alphaproteobacteria bacterium]|nr:glycosyltransferase [Alphaproteobacteria bacterium]
MKILVVSKPWKGGLGRYFCHALKDMFPGKVEWVSTRPQGLADYLRFQRDPEGWWQSLRQRIDTADCAAVFFVGYRKEFRAIRPDMRNVLYIVDDVRMQPGDLGAFGRVFLSDPGYEKDLLALLPHDRFGGILPFAHYPPVHRPAQRAVRRHGVCFIGNRDAKRDYWIEQLLKNDIPVQIVGNYFMKAPVFWRHPFAFRPGVANDAMEGIYARHSVSFNIHAGVVRAGTNMRTFEAAGYGIPQVVEYLEGIEKYFEPEKEILFYRSPEDMAEKTSYLLGNPGFAQQMAQRAHKRAVAEHTYRHRIMTALGHLLPV